MNVGSNSSMFHGFIFNSLRYHLQWASILSTEESDEPAADFVSLEVSLVYSSCVCVI